MSVIIELSKDYGVDVPLGTNNRKDKNKLLRAIKDEFDLHDGEVIKVRDADGNYRDSVRQYKTQTQRINGTVKRIYPNLIVTDLYKEKLEEIKTNDE